MAQGAVSDEIAHHFEAVLALARRDVLRRFVSEAERCIEYDQASAAAILAGIVLDELSLLSDAGTDQTYEPRLNAWHEVRDRAAHPAARDSESDRKALAAMVSEARALLEKVDWPRATLRSTRLSRDALTSIRGKYAFVPTSVEDFLRRKREDSAIENRQ